eukprot:scaffold13046_cov89-Skeletonema_dohrnii-CCMP3373.AAC.1
MSSCNNFNTTQEESCEEMFTLPIINRMIMYSIRQRQRQLYAANNLRTERSMAVDKVLRWK